MSKIDIPIWCKESISPEECNLLTGLGVRQIRALGYLAKMGRGDFPCFWNGSHMKISRNLLSKWIDEMASGHHDIQVKIAEKMVLATEMDEPIKRGRKRKVRSA